MIPLRGVSTIDQTGQPFDDPAAQQTPCDGIRSTRGTTELIELDHHLNAPEFAEAAANKLLSLMRNKGTSSDGD